MAVTCKLNYLKISPRKVRLVADIIRRKKVEEAQSILSFTAKKGAKPLLKLLNSAAASAKNDFQLDSSNLYISKITVDEGPKYKRWRARSRGIASPIQKKTSHITIALDEIIKGKKAKKEVLKKEEKIRKAEDKKEPEAEKPKKEKEQPNYRPEKAARLAGEEKPRLKEAKGIKRFFRRKSM